MKVSASLKRKIAQAVQTSMQIEGCKPVQSDAVKKQAQTLMGQHRVQVSVHNKMLYDPTPVNQHYKETL